MLTLKIRCPAFPGVLCKCVSARPWLSRRCPCRHRWGRKGTWILRPAPCPHGRATARPVSGENQLCDESSALVSTPANLLAAAIYCIVEVEWDRLPRTRVKLLGCPARPSDDSPTFQIPLLARRTSTAHQSTKKLARFPSYRPNSHLPVRRCRLAYYPRTSRRDPRRNGRRRIPRR